MADEFLAQTLAETDELEEELGGGEERPSKTEEMLRQILEDNKQANADLIRQVVGTQRAQPGKPLQEDDPMAGLEFSVDDLPDPSHDPAAFHREYLKRATGAMRTAAQRIEEKVSRRTQQTLSDKELFDKADAMVQAADPTATKTVINVASRAVAERMRAQGKDPLAELRTNMEGMAQDVVDEIDEMRASLTGQRRTSETGASRARGTLGGRNKQPTPKPQEKKHDPLELLHDIHKMQREHRLY